MHMLTYWWEVGWLTCGPTCGHIYWYDLMVYVTKGNIKWINYLKTEAGVFTPSP